MARNVDFERHVVKSGVPHKSEGYQGETQYRTINGTRYLYVKIDGEWMSSPLQTASEQQVSSAPPGIWGVNEWLERPGDNN